jgi:hypothetical protein
LIELAVGCAEFDRQVLSVDEAVRTLPCVKRFEITRTCGNRRNAQVADHGLNRLLSTGSNRQGSRYRTQNAKKFPPPHVRPFVQGRHRIGSQ